MFTGIIEELGKIESISPEKIVITCSKVLNGSVKGDSIAVNGVCLTITDISKNGFSADISPETFRVTNFSKLKKGTSVNLERALTLSTRLGGHIVSGHIDTTGTLSEISKLNEFFEIKVSFDKKFSKYIIKKGSVAVNGISLTIANCGDNFVTIAVIPHTYEMTGLKELKTGDNVNLEFDILAKNVEKNLLSRDNSNITIDFLTQNGFA